MLLTYYVEVNLIAIILAVILIRETVSRTSSGEFSNIVYRISLWILIVMCVGDIVALVSDGRDFAGARVFVIAGNSLFFAAQAMLAYAWLVFFQIRLKYIRTLVSRRTIIVALPLILFLTAVVLNIKYGFLFTVDENNVYQRGEYVNLHWITEGLYVIGAVIQLIIAVLRSKTKSQRREYRSYLLYYLPTLFAGLWQILFFGASTLQIGVAISSLLAFLQFQDSQLIRDELTGLNNRRALHNYEDTIISGGEKIKLTLFMIDVDFFKHINDTYGHICGDEALVQIAQILKRSLSGMPGNRLIIYRYAGDEFVIAGTNMSKEMIQLAKTKIQDEVTRVNESGANPYSLSLSIGSATGECSEPEEFSSILQQADANMYEVKTRKKREIQETDPSLLVR